jgi:AmmeMemoRadiSam system protein A
MEFSLERSEKLLLLQTAREAITARLEGRRPVFPEPSKTLKTRCGAFVTLNEHGKLRGCIGFVTAAKPLVETVKEAAEASALQDPRFEPLRMEELKIVEIEISVLSPLRPIASVEEIEVGRHGIMLRRGYHSGLLLPQVATEYGWDRETFLTHTCYKAGLEGSCWRDPETRIEIFSAVVFAEEEL